MKKINKLQLLCLFLLPVFTVCAQVSKGYKYYREIEPVNTRSYYRIPLGAELLGKSLSDFNDFRVLKVDENDTVENPYLLTWNEPVYGYSYTDEEILNVSFRKGVASYVTVKLPEEKEINQIKLDIAETDFDKMVTIEGSNDNKHWQTIKEDIRIVGFGQQNFAFSTLYFPVSSFTYYLITFNDKTSKPVSVSGVQTFMNNEQKAVYEKIKDVYVVKKEVKKDLKPVPGKQRIYENYTEIKIDLPYRTCINSLQLRSRDKSADFYRTLAVYDSKGNELSSGTFTSLDKDGITTIYLNKMVERKLVVKVFNNDNPPVEGIDVSVYGMNGFLLTRLEPEEKYLLVYGKANAGVPEYDLGYFSDKIADEAKDVQCRVEVAVAVKTPKPKEPFVTQQKWLWITLIGLIVLLGLFAFSLMKKVNKS
ncbi:MAG: hypothetical protein K0S33_385 [Bacteroidetes bacterium]|nr:hypothetical protein [Bacteroidota bacterium]